MWDFVETLLWLGLDAVGPIFSWRFYASLLLTFALVAGILWLVPNSTAASVVAIPVVVIGLLLGFVWDRSG